MFLTALMKANTCSQSAVMKGARLRSLYSGPLLTPIYQAALTEHRLPGLLRVVMKELSSRRFSGNTTFLYC